MPSESETESGVKELMCLFPVAAFDGCLPPIILRHQLYSILSDRTQVDRELVSSLSLPLPSHSLPLSLSVNVDVFDVLFLGPPHEIYYQLQHNTHTHTLSLL